MEVAVQLARNIISKNLLSSTTLAQLNRPDEISKVYQYALRHGPDDGTPSQDDDKIRVSRRIREALIKAAAVGGVPRVVLRILLPIFLEIFG
ncbi:hypothetical protein CHGG_07304 [Chaetomium globosum CBS 148.51]|uniref:Uncharacterized protein n=1 Tax=Chaetomium globosum (strain ATCC 6205 / CBS 148.51 / DSM 1962 / NBRC 6347 / NRRL 1970) TaxID=306901 RepID=Q2GXK0_CHAGB|nr:uncharacterized protein CHGG_07304 [Chaetomium globosum CBS 148.51]EAQ86051.1 hypothetical protein CHGG_07304 [Chaetomium globosum CBS 148.51]